MHKSTVILDPTDEREPIPRPLAARPGQIRGALGIVDISKSRGDVFCDELDRLIAGRLPASRSSACASRPTPSPRRPACAPRWRRAARR